MIVIMNFYLNNQYFLTIYYHFKYLYIRIQLNVSILRCTYMYTHIFTKIRCILRIKILYDSYVGNTQVQFSRRQLQNVLLCYKFD